MLLSLKKLFGVRESKAMAKSRLHFVLVQDRTGLTNEDLAKFKEEMMGVIERYFVIDKSGFDVNYKREGETTTLFINSPIIVRRQESPGSQAGARRQSKLVIQKDAVQKEETATNESDIAPPVEASASEAPATK